MSSSDSDRSVNNEPIHLDPAVAALAKPGPAQLSHLGKVYYCQQSARAVRVPSSIWQLGAEYECENNKKRYWRCSICRNNKILTIDGGTSSVLRYLVRRHKVDKKGQLIRNGKNRQPTIPHVLRAAATTVSNLVTRFSLQRF